MRFLARVGMPIVVSILACGCGLDVTGAEATTSADGGALDASTRDATMPPRDASGARDTGADGVAPPADAANDGFVGGMDAGIDSGRDAGIDAGATDAGCTAATGCFVLPSGWNAVAFVQQPNVACPASYDNQHALLEGTPSATNNACTCDSCSVTTEPSCVSGQVGVYYDTDGSKTCTSSGGVLANTNAGACNAYAAGAFNMNFDVAYRAPGPTGGACASTATKHPSQVTFPENDTVCAPDNPAAVCPNGWCTFGNMLAPFEGCIAKPGVQSCPSGLGLDTSHIVGDSVTFTCSDCGCTLQTTCGDQTMTYYTDTHCTAGALALNATGSCNAQAATNQAYQSYLFSATPSASCTASGTSQASNVSFTNVSTICCAN